MRVREKWMEEEEEKLRELYIYMKIINKTYFYNYMKKLISVLLLQKKNERERETLNTVRVGFKRIVYNIYMEFLFN